LSIVVLPGLIVLFAMILLSPAAAWAQGIKLDDRALADVSDVIVTGRVISIAYGRDPQVPNIYTYVTIEIDEHIKGFGLGNELVVKQSGGRIGDVWLKALDQAVFSVGEEVLVFLVERPHDGTLQTTGLWQGKWTINRDPVSGDGEVSRANASEFEDSRLLDSFVAELRSWIGPQDGSVVSMRRFNTQPAEASAANIDPAASGTSATSCPCPSLQPPLFRLLRAGDSRAVTAAARSRRSGNSCLTVDRKGRLQVG